MLLEEFEGALDEVTHVHVLTLVVLDLVSEVLVSGLEEVEDGKDLSVVGHQSFTDGVRTDNEGLEDLKGHGDDLMVSGVEGSFDWNDELGDNWEHLSSSLLKHVEDSLDGEESVGVGLLADTLKEDGEVMVVVELLDIHFPVDFVLGPVFHGDGKVSSVVEASELRGGNRSALSSTGFRSGWQGLGFGVGSAKGLASVALSLLESAESPGSD